MTLFRHENPYGLGVVKVGGLAQADIWAQKFSAAFGGRISFHIHKYNYISAAGENFGVFRCYLIDF